MKANVKESVKKFPVSDRYTPDIIPTFILLTTNAIIKRYMSVGSFPTFLPIGNSPIIEKFKRIVKLHSNCKKKTKPVILVIHLN